VGRRWVVLTMLVLGTDRVFSRYREVQWARFFWVAASQVQLLAKTIGGGRTSKPKPRRFNDLFMFSEIAEDRYVDWVPAKNMRG
jgi:hypothetical protein